MISIIVAISKNYVIGNKGKLPWKLPADLENFREVTEGHVVVMGRKTYESIGHPLADRTNVILTRDPDFKAPGCTVVHSVADAIALFHEEVFIIGGEELYRLFFPMAQRLYITLIDKHFEGDAFFPKFDSNEWRMVSKVRGKTDDENPYKYWFIVYERVE